MIDYSNDGEYYWEDAEGEALDPGDLPMAPENVEHISEQVSASYVVPGGEWWRTPHPQYWPDDIKSWPGDTTFRPTTYRTLPTCRYCDATHDSIKCPRIKSIEFYEDGTVKRVEFKD